MLTLAIILGSLIIVAVWEFSGSRRRRELPALRRRVSNIGFWTANLFLAAFLLPPAAFVRPHIETLSGVKMPSWPVANAALSLVAGFLLLDMGTTPDLLIEALQHVGRFEMLMVLARQPVEGQRLIDVLFNPAGELGVFA